MECPHQLARPQIPGAHIARRAMRWILLCRPARNHQIPVNDRRRRQRIAARQPAHDLRRIQVHHAVVPKRRIGSTRPRIHRVQLPVAGTKHDLCGRLPIAAPILQPARRRVARRQRIRPQLLAVHRIHRRHPSVRRGDIHDAVDHQGRRLAGPVTRPKLNPARPPARLRLVPHRASRIPAGGRRRTTGETLRLHVIDPRDLQLSGVLRRDLLQGREPHGAGIMAIRAPLLRRIHRRSTPGHWNGCSPSPRPGPRRRRRNRRRFSNSGNFRRRRGAGRGAIELH